jgi:predicted transcriptional regulator
MAFYQKRLIQTDQLTGEEARGLAVLIPIRQKLKDDFAMLTGQGLIKLATDPELKHDDLKVLMTYLGSVKFKNLIQISQRDVAEILGMHKQHVSRATIKLLSKNILLEESKTGRSKIYRLNTFYGWKGKINKTYTELYEKDSQLIVETWKKKEKITV